MTYLHDKNIVHGKLTSVNIYLELNQRVKISLLDNHETSIAENNSSISQNYTDSKSNTNVKFNLPSLTYLSPELVKTIRLVETSHCDKASREMNVTVDTNQLTKKSDVFSFGTLLFELFEERFPFSNEENLDDEFVFTPIRTPSTPYVISESKLRSKNWNGNIKMSASELIYQIGSGQIVAKNLSKSDSSNCTLVESIISSCWSADVDMRPQFDQFYFC